MDLALGLQGLQDDLLDCLHLLGFLKCAVLLNFVHDHLHFLSSGHLRSTWWGRLGCCPSVERVLSGLLVRIRASVIKGLWILATIARLTSSSTVWLTFAHLGSIE